MQGQQETDWQQGVLLMVHPNRGQQLLHHRAHDSAEPCAAHHSQYLVLGVVWIPYLIHTTSQELE